MWQIAEAGRTSLDLNLLRARRARAQARTGRRNAGALALLLLLLVSVLLSLRPRHFYLNGLQLPLTAAGTAADCARHLGFGTEPGDLVDVRGGLLVKGRGLPPVFMREGEPLALGDLVRGGNRVAAYPGRDVTEPVVTDLERLRPRPRLASGERVSSDRSFGLVGLRREEWGVYSEKLASVEIAQVSPVLDSSAAAASKLIALTFDDGPSPSYTPGLLAVLEEYQVKATFFALGVCASGHPDLLKQVAAAGHEIGVHSWSHPMLTKWDSERITSDARRCVRFFQATAGPIPVRWMRPPYGDTNSRVQAAIEAAGLKQILWDVDTQDWRRPGADVIVQRVLRNLRPGAVVLMHDGGGPREGTVAAVRKLLPELRARGYYPVTLSELKSAGDVFRGTVIYRIADQDFRVAPTDPPLAMLVDGVAVELDLPPLKCNGQLLVPAVPLFEKLGTTCVYEAATQSLLLSGPTGQYRLRLDSLRAEKNGQELTLQLPPILYHDRAFVPLWALTNITGASAQVDYEERALNLFSAGLVPQQSPEVARGSRWLLVAGFGDPLV